MGLLMHTHQQLLCDINHVSCESMCLYVASLIVGTIGHDMDAPLAWHINSMPIDYDDDDWSSSEPEMEAGDDKVTLNVSNEITALSNCSDELIETSSGMHEPSVGSNLLLEEWDNMYCEPNEGQESVLVIDQPTNNIDESDLVQLACI